MIRQFRTEDATACCMLIRSCLREDSALSTAIREKLLQAETPGSISERARLFYVIVCELEGAILGVAGVDMNEVRLLCVLPGYQQRGIGRALYEHIEAIVSPDFFSDIFVYSSLQATGFYRACGFREKGPVIFDLGDGILHTVFMTRSLRYRSNS